VQYINKTLTIALAFYKQSIILPAKTLFLGRSPSQKSGMVRTILTNLTADGRPLTAILIQRRSAGCRQKL
jgi:hypothetical protein